VGTKTILIVDEEEKNIKLLKAMLKSENYRLFGALSGMECLKMVEDISPDLILLDVMMPEINGFEVCRRIKKEEKTKAIPIVMVSILTGGKNRLKAMEAGADDFLNKPVDKTELLIRVKSLLRIKAYHDALRQSYNEIAEKNEKLLELGRIKEGLTQMIIHDVRSLLMSISLTLEPLLLDKEHCSESDFLPIKNCLNYCSEIKQMIQSFLDIHKMEEGKLELAKELTNPVELIDEVLEQFITKTELEQISLSFPMPVDSPSIWIDWRLIQRVIANLLNNAIRHTPKGGKIEVAMDFLPDKESLCISVKDSGDGLDPEYHQKIFKKFEQAKIKRNGVKVGTSGLGLAFCKMAVEAHEGRIWVESEGKGKGCTFSFVLPV